MTAPLVCQRDAFSLPPDLHYLNCAYMSPLAKRVEAAGAAALRRKRVPTEISPADFFRDLDKVREQFARLVGVADPARIAVIPAASYGLAAAARNTPVDAGQNIVLVAGQFPSNVYIWRARARRRRAEVRTVAPVMAARRGESWNARVLEAIDPATAVVALPPVHWTDGTRFDLAAIGDAARARGAALVIDGTQTVGAMPFDVAQLRPDALVCAAYKWLLGPYATGVAYFGSRYDEGEPLEETWTARVGSDDFRRLVDYQDAYRPGAVRYDVGEACNFALLPMLLAGLDLLLEWQVPRIEAYCRTLTDPLIAEARERGFGVEDDAWRAAHLVGFAMPRGTDLLQLEAALAAHRVAASVRGDVLRISPHVYNDAADIEALLAVLRDRHP